MIVKGTTKSGIKFQLDSNIKNDARLVFLMVKSQNADDPMVSGKALIDLLSLMFGSNDNVMTFMNEVADKHKGICSPKDMISELREMLDAIEGKNS